MEAIQAKQSENLASIVSMSRQDVLLLHFQWLDLTGILRERLVSTERADKLVRDKKVVALRVPADSPTPNAYVQRFDVGTCQLVPDFETTRTMSFSPGHASVMCNFVNSQGVPLDSCPRFTLHRIATHAEQLDIKVAFEISFDLLLPLEEGDSPKRALPDLGKCSAHAFTPDSKAVKVIEEIAWGMKVNGFELAEMHSWDSNGQLAITTGMLTPMKAVDTLVQTKEIIHNVAKKHGFRVTFMSRVWRDNPASLSRVYLSLGANVDRAAVVQGLVDHLPALCAFCLPTTISNGSEEPDTQRKSYGSPISRDGPICLSVDGTTIQVDGFDGPANPYLVVAALISSSMLGKVDKPASSSKRQPMNLEPALHALMVDEQLVGTLGSGIVKKYVGAVLSREETTLAGGIEYGRMKLADIY